MSTSFVTNNRWGFVYDSNQIITKDFSNKLMNGKLRIFNFFSNRITLDSVIVLGETLADNEIVLSFINKVRCFIITNHYVRN